MKKTLLTTVLLTVFTLTANAAPQDNAGSISRQVEEKRLPELAAPISPVQMEETNTISPDSTPFTVSEVRLQGNSLLPAEQIQPLLDELTGKTVALGDLQGLANKINQLYTQAGYPLVSVVVPAQTVENGVVTLSVIESQIVGVEINNQSRLKDSRVAAFVNQAIRPNEHLNQAQSERALLLLKDLAGTEEVNYRLTGTNTGTVVGVDLSPAPLIDGSVSVDNYGSQSTGRVRTRGNLNINSPLGFGEKMSVQAMSSFKGVDYAALGVDVPVGTQGLSVGANVSHTRYDLGGDFKDLDATGNATAVSGSVYYPLLRSNRQNVWLNGGMENRHLRDEVGATDTVTRKEINAGNIGIGASLQDNVLAGGLTSLNLTNTFGHLKFKDADAEQIDKVSAKTAGSFYKLNASVGRTQYFTPKLSAYLGVQGQIANKNLDSAEQLSLGGADAVAAYHANDVSVDEGVIGQVQLSYAITPYVSVYGFYDAGRGRLHDKPYIADTDNMVSVTGGGIGLNAQYKGFNLQSKIAWHGHEKNGIESKKNAQFWVKAGYRF